jgi:hypothetical protein
MLQVEKMSYVSLTEFVHYRQTSLDHLDKYTVLLFQQFESYQMKKRKAFLCYNVIYNLIKIQYLFCYNILLAHHLLENVTGSTILCTARLSVKILENNSL